MTPADPDLNLSATCLSLSRSDGTVQGGWAAARACNAAGPDALVNRRQLVLAERVQPVENAAVSITRRAGVLSGVETVSKEAWFSNAIISRSAREMVASAHETMVVPNPLADGAVW